MRFASCLPMFDASKPKTMDYKSMLIGGLASALLFVSIGAGTPERPINESNLPESHVWEFHLSDAAQGEASMAFAINKKTGEVRKYSSAYATFSDSRWSSYRVCSPN